MHGSSGTKFLRVLQDSAGTIRQHTAQKWKGEGRQMTIEWLIGLRHSLNHIARQFLEDFQPSLLDQICEIILQSVLEGGNDGFAHNGKHFRLDSISFVFASQIQHDLRQQRIVWTKHAQGSVHHLNQITSVHKKSLTCQEFLRVSVDINGKTKECLGWRGFFEQTDGKQE